MIRQNVQFVPTLARRITTATTLTLKDNRRAGRSVEVAMQRTVCGNCGASWTSPDMFTKELRSVVFLAGSSWEQNHCHAAYYRYIPARPQ
jgi:hypothetical protein